MELIYHGLPRLYIRFSYQYHPIITIDCHLMLIHDRHGALMNEYCSIVTLIGYIDEKVRKKYRGTLMACQFYVLKLDTNIAVSISHGTFILNSHNWPSLHISPIMVRYGLSFVSWNYNQFSTLKLLLWNRLWNRNYLHWNWSTPVPTLW